MAFSITNIHQARAMVERAKERMESLREKTESAIGTGLQIAEVSGAALGFGYANGRWGQNGELSIGGVPVDLGAALVLHGAAFLGGFGKYAEHGHNLGTGALAACAYRTGAQMGAAAAVHAHAPHAQQLQTAAPNALPPWAQPPWAALPQQPPQQQPATPQGVTMPGFVPQTPPGQGGR